MRFMLLKMSPRTGPSDLHEEAQFVRSLHAAGVLLSADLLEPPTIGARVEWPSGMPQVHPRWAREMQREIVRYWVIDAKSLAEAVEWAKRCPCTETEAIEVRQILEPVAHRLLREPMARH